MWADLLEYRMAIMSAKLNDDIIDCTNQKNMLGW